MSDLTSSTRSTQHTKDELEHIRYALDQSAIVATTDVSGRITHANDKFCDISKYSRGELVGQDHRIVNSGHHSAAFMLELWKTISGGETWRGELRNRAKDGSFYWVDTTIVPFLDTHGKPWQYMAIHYDITERKRQEARLRDQATLTSLGEMAAVLAHEVRNPLAGIRGGVQLLASSFPEHSDGRELTTDIVARIDSLNAVLGDLLSFARIREIRLAPVDVDAFLRDLASSMRLDPAMSRVTVTIDIEPQLEINADVDQLRIVFTNLVLNAAQAMAGEGQIRLTARRDGDEHVALGVEDSGPGIPGHLRERIFQPFFTTKTRGTGLGLPTARRIIDAHGGGLTVEESTNGGTVMRIRLSRAGA